jgi:DinB superfamily
MRPNDIEPDTKDWTWTIERACPECGFAAGEVDGPSIADRVPALTDPWQEVLTRTAVRERTEPATWSPLEYGAHVRDVLTVFTERANLMLREDAPEFADWDQDQAAVDGRYHEQDPASVAAEIREAAADAAAAFAAVRPEQWTRTGKRSNGSHFTVETLGQYFLHDLAHHLVDVHA